MPSLANLKPSAMLSFLYKTATLPAETLQMSSGNCMTAVASFRTVIPFMLMLSHVCTEPLYWLVLSHRCIQQTRANDASKKCSSKTKQDIHSLQDLDRYTTEVSTNRVAGEGRYSTARSMRRKARRTCTGDCLYTSSILPGKMKIPCCCRRLQIVFADQPVDFDASA